MIVITLENLSSMLSNLNIQYPRNSLLKGEKSLVIDQLPMTYSVLESFVFTSSHHTHTREDEGENKVRKGRSGRKERKRDSRKTEGLC